MTWIRSLFGALLGLLDLKCKGDGQTDRRLGLAVAAGGPLCSSLWFIDSAHFSQSQL